MLLNDFLDYGTIHLLVKIQDIDTKKIIYQGANISYKDEQNYKVSYFKIETIENENYIFIGVYRGDDLNGKE